MRRFGFYAFHGQLPRIISEICNTSFAIAEGKKGRPAGRCGNLFPVSAILGSVPEVSAKLKEPITTHRKIDEVVKSAQSMGDAGVLNGKVIGRTDTKTDTKGVKTGIAGLSRIMLSS